jgi:hypothetical protein
MKFSGGRKHPPPGLELSHALRSESKAYVSDGDNLTANGQEWGLNGGAKQDFCFENCSAGVSPAVAGASRSRAWAEPALSAAKGCPQAGRRYA